MISADNFYRFAREYWALPWGSSPEKNNLSKTNQVDLPILSLLDQNIRTEAEIEADENWPSSRQNTTINSFELENFFILISHRFKLYFILLVDSLQMGEPAGQN